MAHRPFINRFKGLKHPMEHISETLCVAGPLSQADRIPHNVPPVRIGVMAHPASRGLVSLASALAIHPDCGGGHDGSG